MGNLGKNIREFRKKKGLSQAELGKKLGLSQKVISAYERDYRVPRGSIIPHVAETLDVSVNALYEGTENTTAAQRLLNPELWKIVERLEKLPPSVLKTVSALVEKSLSKKRKK